MAHLDIVLNVSEGPFCEFVEIEDENGKGVDAGEWIKREDGYQAIRIKTRLDEIDHLEGESQALFVKSMKLEKELEKAVCLLKTLKSKAWSKDDNIEQLMYRGEPIVLEVNEFLNAHGGQ